ncbi:MAG: hypothetical protein JF603_15470 [Acidobacteria bacterium]|nr:hypothetical protein [Acidobacteriota bacterium]
MVTALLAVTVATALGVTAMQLALHSGDASAFDRARTQAIHAAEAGLDATNGRISRSSGDALPCTGNGTTSATPSAAWSVVVSYFQVYPPSGAPLTCKAGGLLPPGTTPRGVQVRSTAAVKVAGGTVTRVMQSQGQITPVYGAFTEAVFSDSTPGLTNQLNLHGYEGNDADFYTNGNWSCPNQTTVSGTIIARGTISVSNSCSVAVDVWAGGSVSLSNRAYVAHDAVSSTSSVAMANNSHVGHNAKAGTTCTGCTTGITGRVGGIVTTNSPQAAPTQRTYPTINYDAAAWTAADYAIVDTTCANARTWLLTPANRSVKAVLHITGGCTLTLSNDTVTRTNDLAIVTDGPIVTSSNTLFRSGDSAFHDLHLIVQTGPICTTNVAGAPGTIFMSSSTAFSTLHFFVYAPCEVSFANNNSGSHGQIYGNPVVLGSNVSYTYYPTVVPGAGQIIRFITKVSFVREIL